MSVFNKDIPHIFMLRATFCGISNPNAIEMIDDQMRKFVHEEQIVIEPSIITLDQVIISFHLGNWCDKDVMIIRRRLIAALEEVKSLASNFASKYFIQLDETTNPQISQHYIPAAAAGLVDLTCSKWMSTAPDTLVAYLRGYDSALTQRTQQADVSLMVASLASEFRDRQFVISTRIVSALCNQITILMRHDGCDQYTTAQLLSGDKEFKFE